MMSDAMDAVCLPTFEPFSREPEYIEVNRRFIQNLKLDGSSTIADLAAGTGAMTTLILEQLARERLGAPESTCIVGIELSDEAIGLARDHLAGEVRNAVCTVRHLRASIEALPVASGSLDAAIIGNAIQLVPDKERLVAEVHRALCVGGLFAFNTSFYAGAYLPGTERFYLQWVQEAVRYISGAVRADVGQASVERGPRQRGRSGPAFSNRWLSPNEYRGLLERHGFVVLHMTERTVPLTLHSLRAIGAYPGLASVLLSGYPVPLACEALTSAAEPALRASGLSAVPRGWLEISARKLDRTPSSSTLGHV